MGDEQAAAQAPQGFLGDLCERRRSGHHVVGDAGELFNEGRNSRTGIDQLLPFANRAVIIDFDDADFGDAVMGSGGAGSFEVDKGEGRHAAIFARWAGPTKLARTTRIKIGYVGWIVNKSTTHSDE